MSSRTAWRRRVGTACGLVRARLWAISHRGIVTGSGARLGRHCRLIVDGRATLVLSEGCEVDDGTTLAVYGSGVLVLGPGSFVGHHGTLAARRSVSIGAGTYLAELVSVRDHDHAVGEPPSSGRVTIADVAIGSHAWLGAKATVLKGSTIGDGAVVGANAVVRGEVPPSSVAVGVPARVVGLVNRRATTQGPPSGEPPAGETM